MPDEEQTDFERAYDLKPLGQVTADEATTELAKINDPASLSSHPYWVGQGRQHDEAVQRVVGLTRRQGGGESDLAKSLHEIGIDTPEDLERVADKGFSDISREELDRQFEDLKDQFAREGGANQDFSAVLLGAQGLVKTLTEQKVLEADFHEFLAETGAGDELGTIRLFNSISQLATKYAEWKQRRSEESQ